MKVRLNIQTLVGVSILWIRIWDKYMHFDCFVKFGQLRKDFWESGSPPLGHTGQLGRQKASLSPTEGLTLVI